MLVLVLGDAHRHRELDERIAVLEQLRRDPAPVPPYAKDFAVVFGPAGLRAFLAQHTRRRAAAAELAQVAVAEGLALPRRDLIIREIGRAIGRLGSAALPALAAHHGRLVGQAATDAERVAWAMAHIAARGGKPEVAALASEPPPSRRALSGCSTWRRWRRATTFASGPTPPAPVLNEISR